MKTLRKLKIRGGLLLGGTGVPAAVGDQVQMYLDTDANSDFPEFIYGIIQHPIVLTDCGSSTEYSVEYDEADLEGAVDLLRPQDVVDTILTTQYDILDELKANIASPTFTGVVTVPALVGTVQALSGAGAVNLTTLATAVTSTGAAQALTLANGTNGQIKVISYVVDGGSSVLTPTTKTGFTTITFTNAGETAVLQYFTTVGWLILSLRGAIAA